MYCVVLAFTFPAVVFIIFPICQHYKMVAELAKCHEAQAERHPHPRKCDHASSGEGLEIKVEMV